MSDFHLRGAIPISSVAYIERAFESRILEHLLAAQWVLFLGPRQHGKSTCLLRLKAKLLDVGLNCAIIDLQAQPPFERYEEFLHWFTRRLTSDLGFTLDNTPDPADVKQLDAWLEKAIPRGVEPIVIIIDEASVLKNKEWRNSFYGQIRAMANEDNTDQPEKISARIRFLFAGCFRYETLVDDLNSPFNVCERIYTEDLTLEETFRLNNQVTESEDEATVRAAFEIVGGQPYLLQFLLSKVQIATGNKTQALEEAINSLRNGDDDHFEGVFSKVISEPQLTKLVADLARNSFIPNEPANSDYKYLQVLGVAKRDGSNLIFRNNLYAEFARGSTQIVQEAGNAQHSGVLMPPAIDAYSFMQSPELAEIAYTMELGGVRAHNTQSYRLALAGFGSACEAVLIDWLLSLSAADLSLAVRLAKNERRNAASFRHPEVETDPKTFRLVNLIKVARKVPNPIRVMDPPEALREWRNLIHPAEAIRHYLSEDLLEPESRTASGLIATIRREVSAII